MMQVNEIKSLLTAHFDNAHIEVTVEGSHVNIVIVSSQFDGLGPVKKQQLVYAALAKPIASGEIHAVNMKTYTPTEWKDNTAT